MLKSEAKKLLKEALELVESKSIRAWATSKHNRPIFEKIAATYGWETRELRAQRLALNITCLAIGL